MAKAPENSDLHLGQRLNVNPVAVRRVVAESTASRAHAPRCNASTRPKTHAYATLVYHTAGQATFEQNGRWQVGPGDVLLIPAGQPHQRLTTEPSDYWGLGICMPCFGPHDGFELPDPFERVRKGASAVVSIAGGRQSYTNALFQELAASSDNPSAPNSVAQSHAAVQRSLLTLILNEVQIALNDTPASSALRAGVAADALRFIEDNCMRPLTLQQVARAVGRSSAYVTTALSQATGKSVVEWITTYRLTQARTLLVRTDERVETIAARIGYRDTTHFIRMFRRSVGVTPAAYRSSQRHRIPS